MSVQHAIYAHSLPGGDVSDWEPLATHAAAVAHAAEARAAAFGWGPAANALGLLHDLGKVSDAFEMYLRAGPSAQMRVDHSTAGARVARTQFPGAVGRLLAFGVAGHHAGLPDAEDLIRRLDPGRTPLADFSRWKDVVSLPEPRALATCAALDVRAEPAFAAAFLTACCSPAWSMLILSNPAKAFHADIAIGVVSLY